MTKINEDEAAYYLKVFRQARYAALEDAENFREACFALEEFGCYLNGENTKSLRKYSTVLRNFVKSKRKQEFSILFDLVVEARNEAAHRGVFARNLSGKSVRLSLTIISTQTIISTHGYQHAKSFCLPVYCCIIAFITV